MAKILLADDDVAVRDFIRRALEMDDHDVICVHEGGEVLQRFQAEGEDYDLMLIDICMPVIDGKTLAKKIMSGAPKLPILLMTGFSVDDVDKKQLSPNVIDILFKPFTLSSIRTAVESAVGGQRRFNFG